ncbi:MAG TPA: prolyl oligopeptidase family serine peptidase [Candidatus Udaeobacter sp.]|jgi:prolyl oligopeptidase|nr:prolyl oligopeptidase family serine peptidase [Candidatus Udaeobacter sp.]
MKLCLAVSCLLTLFSMPALAATTSKVASSAKAKGGANADPYLWLENVTGTKALAWVKEQDVRSKKALAESPEFEAMNARFRTILDSKEKIPFVEKIGDRYYNFWRDDEHPRGLWRRTTLAEYRKDHPAWESVLDLDALDKSEKENWVWKGANPLPPDYTLCLVSLSRGGADAVVVREFDLKTREFVKGGFTLPEAKSNTAWKNKDELWMGTDSGPGSMTTSGYPNVVKVWKRGTPPSAAKLVYQGKVADVGSGGFHDFTPGFERDFIQRAPTFFTNELFLVQGGKPVKIEKPDDADAGVHREWLLIRLRTDWSVGGKTWPGGALLATRLDDFLAGKREFEALFTPTERKSLDGYSTTLHTILLNELDNVKSRIEVLRHDGRGWTRSSIPAPSEFGAMGASGVDDFESDDYFLTVTDFLTPTTLFIGTAGTGSPERLKHSPSFFDAKGLRISQHEAVSKDGTHVPYFQVARGDLKNDGTAPTMLNGYGGFEVSNTPTYSGLLGSGWLEKGGVFVLANIRGGGEFGPKWHEAALKANRLRAYEDFAAVGQDLIQRKVTSPAHLGCIGGSNGGLLVGNMLTQYPELFGAIVCESPLLDMKRYNHLLAGASWMGEYGNPDLPKEWAFIRTFSPYANAKKDAHYPPTLFTSSTRDDRVHPGHARKMVAKLEAQGHDVLYYENVEGGHAGSADNKQLAFMTAMAYTFLWQHLK